MALIDSTWYTNFGDGSTTGYYAITRRPQNAAVAAGQIVRQFTAPAVGSERVFVCIIAGTTANVTDATWVLTRGAKTTDGTATWMECSGQAALNGDLTNTSTWAQAKAATPAVLGQVIKRSNNASYQICTTAGAMSASEPTMSDTAGVTTTDTTAVWTSLGAVSNFTGGQAPHARLANALATNWFASGNTVYVGDNHAETQTGSITLAPASALMAKILCHNHSGSYPPAVSDITTGATITSSNNLINFTGQGSFYFYGLTFINGSTGTQVLGAGSVGQTQNWYYFDNCSWQLTTSNCVLQLGASSTAWGIIIFNNTTIKLASANIVIWPYFVLFIWQNTGQILAAGSSIPTTLFSLFTTTGRFSNITLNNLDLSQLTGSLFSNASNPSIGTLIVQDCKLNAAMTVTTPINTGMNVQLIRSDSAGTSYKSTRYAYEGIETTETSIVRTGGAVDPLGQAQSRKIVTSANAQWLRPYKAEPMVVWNAVTGTNRVVTVYGTVNAGALPNNDDLWLECEYLGSATDPLGKIVTTTKASVLASNAAVASDSSVWNVSAPTTAVWSSPTNVTLSGGNLVATNTGTTSVDQGAHSLTQQDVGKFYFETTFTTMLGGNNLGVGIGTPASTYTGMGNSGGVTGAIVFRNSGNVWVNGVSNATNINGGAAFASGVVIGFAVDLTNRLFWCRVAPSGNWNGSGTANPATGVGGIAFSTGPMVPFVTFGGTGGAANNVITANFGASSFTGTVPSGFTSGWPDIWQSFKLTATLSAPQPQLAGYLHARVRAAKASTTFYIDPQINLS